MEGDGDDFGSQFDQVEEEEEAGSDHAPPMFKVKKFRDTAGGNGGGAGSKRGITWGQGTSAKKG